MNFEFHNPTRLVFGVGNLHGRPALSKAEIVEVLRSAL